MSLKDELIKFGSQHPDLRDDVEVVLDRIREAAHLNIDPEDITADTAAMMLNRQIEKLEKGTHQYNLSDDDIYSLKETKDAIESGNYTYAFNTVRRKDTLIREEIVPKETYAFLKHHGKDSSDYVAASRSKVAVPEREINDLFDRLEMTMKKVFERCEPMDDRSGGRRQYDIEIKGDDAQGDADFVVEDGEIKEINLEIHDPDGQDRLGRGRISLPRNRKHPSERSLRDRLQGIKGQAKRYLNQRKNEEMSKKRPRRPDRHRTRMF